MLHLHANLGQRDILTPMDDSERRKQEDLIFQEIRDLEQLERQDEQSILRIASSMRAQFVRRTRRYRYVRERVDAMPTQREKDEYINELIERGSRQK